MKTIVIAAAMVAGAAMPALAQDRPAPAGGMPGTAGNVQVQTLPAESFVKSVAVSDMFEIESSKLAQQKARDSKLKSFAQQMVQDHGKTSSELKQVVSKAKLTGIRLPKQLDEKHAQMMQELKGASGPEFDQTYHRMQVQAHQDAVSLFENYARNGDNNDLKAWASKTVPALKSHLSKVQDWKPAALTGQGGRDRR